MTDKPEQPSPPRQWVSVEDAPKTGEHILVARFDGVGFGTCGGKKQAWQAVVHWWANPGEEGWYLSSGGADESAVHPTHWMPLPAPPEDVK